MTPPGIPNRATEKPPADYGSMWTAPRQLNGPSSRKSVLELHDHFSTEANPCIDPAIDASRHTVSAARRFGVCKIAPSPEVGWVTLAEPPAIDVAELAEQIPLSTHEDVGEIGEEITTIDGRTILWFQPATSGGGFGRIYSPLPPYELAGWLAEVQEEQRNELFTLLNLPELSPVVLSNFQQARRQAVVDWGFLESHFRLPQQAPTLIEHVGGPPQELARGISQRAYGVSNAESDMPVIGTSGLGPCIAVTFYRNGVAAIAHVDSMTDTDSLGGMLREMGIEPGSPDVQVRLIGGEFSARHLAIRILRSLQGLGLKPEQADIINKPHPSQFAIDTRTGAIYYGYGPVIEAAEKPATEGDTSFRLHFEFDGRARSP